MVPGSTGFFATGAGTQFMISLETQITWQAES